MVFPSDVPLLRPDGSGYMPLFTAALWIATEGHRHDVEHLDQGAWNTAYGELMNRVSAGEVGVTGLHAGERIQVPGHELAVRVVLPAAATPLELIFRAEPYLATGPLGDSLESKGRVKYTQLMVNKASVARYWPYGQESTNQPSSLSEPETPGSPPPIRYLQLALDDKTVVVRDPSFRFGPADSRLIVDLRKTYEQSRQDGLAPESYRFVPLKKLSENRQTASKRVRRCRAALEEHYKRSYGQEPPPGLLLQSTMRGVRLNPETRFVSLGQIGRP
jgi:hypothetical protein